VPSKHPAPAAKMTIRTARPADVPRIAEVIAAADLPPLFIEGHLDGFVVGERGGEIVACGGIEFYGDCAVVRSVVCDERLRGQGAGSRIAGALIERGRAAGVADIYLFTGDALPFWERHGFVEVTMDDWKEPPRACWQYQFISRADELRARIHTMWRRA
jgi:amino-acid N-acetyltransferase